MIESIVLYFTSFASSLAFSGLYKKAKSFFGKILCFILLAAPTVLLSSLRYGIGTDYFGYLESYRSINTKVDWSNVFNFYQEPAWVVLNLISNSYFVVLLLSSIIYSVFIFFSIARCKDKIGIIFPLFISYMVFYCLSFNGIRQAIAASILLFATTFLLKKKSKIDYIFFFVLVAIAGTFHKSAFIYALVFFLYLLKGNKISVVLALTFVASVIILVFHSQIAFALKSIGFYSSYLETESNGGFGFFLYIFPVLVICLYILYSNRKQKDALFLLRIFITQIPLQLLGVYISYADRLAEYGLASQILFVPFTVSLVKSKKEKMVFVAILTAWYIFYFFFMFVYLGSNGVFPYKSIFSV